MTTSTDLTLANSPLAERMEYAKALSHSGLLPDAYRGKPANILLAIDYGNALNIPPVQAFVGIHVIGGKPSMGADLMAAVIRRAGHKLRIIEHENPLSVSTELIRADDPDFTFKVTWTIEKAKAAGLWGTGNWKQYPGQMMRARAISEIARQGASDALMGITYVPEELGADIPPTGTPAPAVDISDAQVLDDNPDPITTKTRAHLFALFTQKGITDRAKQLDGINFYTGRRYTSRADLTEADALTVIDTLKTIPDAPVAETVDAELVEEEAPSE